MRIKLIIFGMLLPLLTNAASDFDREQIKKRIRPIGEVRVTKDPSQETKPSETAQNSQKAVAEEQDPGAKIYEQYCKTCHQNGLAGAPKYRVDADWKPRMAEKSMDDMVANAIKGINAMPPKGTCMSCSDEDIRLAVEYMVPKS